MGLSELVFDLKALKANIKGALNRFYHCIFYQESDTNMFFNCLDHYCDITWYRVVTMTHHNLLVVKSWKLFLATLRSVSPYMKYALIM